MSGNNDARNSPIASDERLRNALRRQIDRVVNVSREFTRAQLADESGVNIHTIDAILSRDPGKRRRIACEDALSIAAAIGDTAVNALLAVINYAGRRLDEPEALQPMRIAADSMAHLAIIARNASDGRIDHTEERETTDAADMLIATVLPLSSAGRAS